MALLMPRLEPLITYADCAKCSADVARRRCAIGLISNARWIVCKSVSDPNLLRHIRYAQILGYSDTEMPRYSDTYIYMYMQYRCVYAPMSVLFAQAAGQVIVIVWNDFPFCRQVSLRSVALHLQGARGERKRLATGKRQQWWRRSGFDSPDPWTITCNSSHQKVSAALPYIQTYIFQLAGGIKIFLYLHLAL